MEYSGQFSVAQGGRPSVYNQTVPQDAPERTPIRDGVTQAEQVLSELHEAISALEKRIDTVVRPVPPSTASAGSSPTPTAVCSHVMGRINILNDGFSHAIARLRELASRVEL